MRNNYLKKKLNELNLRVRKFWNQHFGSLKKLVQMSIRKNYKKYFKIKICL